MLQFQTDVSAAQLARVQGLSDLRQLLGYDRSARTMSSRGIRLPAGQGQPEDFQAKALRNRPDFRAAQQAVTAANSQHALQKPSAKET